MRSALAAAVVVAAAAIAGAVAFVAAARSTLTGDVEGAATQRAGEVAAAIQSGDPAFLARELRPNAADLTVIQVIDRSGRVSAASTQISGAPPLTPLRPAPGQRGWETRALATAEDGPFRILALGVPANDGAHVVVVAQSLRPVTESVAVMTRTLTLGMPVLVLVVGVATFMFVGRTLRPVEGIRRRVAAITGRDLHARIPVPGSGDEVAALAETMNAMLDRLETSAKAQRRFVADASHELRSPLTTIQVGLDLLASTDTAGQPKVQRLQAETRRLERLVADLLLLARADEHGLTMRGDDVDLDDLALRERDRLATQHPQLSVRAQIAPARVHGDAHHLAQAVRNLVDNAARHASTRVTLAVWSDAGGGHLVVADDGPGVAPADVHRILDRFVRLDDARTRADGGSGLGLAITREIVTAHGGEITVTDHATGVDHGGGAVFHIRLPPAEPTATAVALPPSAASGPNRTGPSY
jgi:signal transduction histidine kinase